MINKIVNRAVDQFVCKNIIKSNERAIYEYGLKNGIILVWNLLTIILIGAVSGHLQIAIIFMLCFVPLRTYAGGYHAKSPVACYVISVAIIIGAIAAVLAIGNLAIIWSIPLSLIIYVLSPVETPKKKLSNRQKHKYQSVTAVILMVLFIFCVISQFGSIIYLKETIIVAEAIMCISEIGGYIDNKI